MVYENSVFHKPKDKALFHLKAASINRSIVNLKSELQRFQSSQLSSPIRMKENYIEQHDSAREQIKDQFKLTDYFIKVNLGSADKDLTQERFSTTAAAHLPIKESIQILQDPTLSRKNRNKKVS